jgi:hypothetical protein
MNKTTKYVLTEIIENRPFHGGQFSWESHSRSAGQIFIDFYEIHIFSCAFTILYPEGTQYGLHFQILFLLDPF